ncbi:MULTISPECIES: PSPA7_2676 family Cys-rich small protein [unclassified Pseudomonas]|jgi:hypothetical protein|nr:MULTISPECIES: PSPA7_2676 family Cys-rich small protein [unclassified Pseudomonas]MCU1720244.1 hypothetical protein [Pseudomonas sp. 5P_5.1_Bac1]MCU1733593.1 hypothetical protein [Pseudomonas sp. 20P_3.2_Bac4]MCU1743257.1 hypothetical protein [Pseudomonas sp. 20P_3.2_Bac5]
MTFICLLRGCQWRSMSSSDVEQMDCQCCERCGAVRYRRLGITHS